VTVKGESQRRPGPRSLSERRIHVGEVDQITNDLAFGRDTLPVGDERNAAAALKKLALTAVNGSPPDRSCYGSAMRAIQSQIP
jgi:hypothetical protein